LAQAATDSCEDLVLLWFTPLLSQET